MIITKTLYAENRKKWRSWLRKNHKKEKEIWLIYYKKSSGKLRIPYNHAVEEALCYGWIDSTVKSIDHEKFAQRFTARRPKSNLSEMNKERIRILIEEKKMTPAGIKAVDSFIDSINSHELLIAKDIKKALKKNKEVWKNFQKFPDSYKRIRIGYIENQRGHNKQAFEKSLNNFIKMTAKNKKFGMIR